MLVPVKDPRDQHAVRGPTPWPAVSVLPERIPEKAIVCLDTAFSIGDAFSLSHWQLKLKRGTMISKLYCCFGPNAPGWTLRS